MARNKKGFTLVELMVVIAILGILAASALPVYRTWQQRAYGAEAKAMLRIIITAEMNYNANYQEYYPSGSSLSIYHDGGMEPDTAVEDVKEKLGITIPKGHFMDYTIYGGEDFFYIEINSAGSFDLFKNASQISANIDKNGKETVEYH